MPAKTASGILAGCTAILMLFFLLFSGTCSAAETAAEHSGADTWPMLQETIRQAEDGDVVILSGDLTASQSDTMLVIETGKRVTLDLHISLPGKYTMLVRYIATIEGVIEQLCPELNLFQQITDKLMDRVKRTSM